MGAIILFVCVSIVLAFLSGALFIFILMINSYDDKNVHLFILAMCCLGFSIWFSIMKTQEYYEEKEWSSVKYNLEKKVIPIEEDNTIKLDTIYTFTHR